MPDAPLGHGRDNPPIEPGWVLVLIGLAVVALAQAFGL
jgi:hypothetical protein